MDIKHLRNILPILCVLIKMIKTQDACLQDNCVSSAGVICNGVGTCECGTCVCEATFSGPTCEECPDCPDSCDVYSACVSCKIYSTGLMGFFECLDCDYLANFDEVNKAEFDMLGADGGFDVCERINEKDCVESFKIGGMNEGKRDLFVLTPMDCTERNRQVIEAVYPDILPDTTLKISKTTSQSPPETTEVVTETPENEAMSESEVKNSGVDNVVSNTIPSTERPNKNADSDSENMNKNNNDEPTNTYEVGPEKAGAVSGNAEVSDESKSSGIQVGSKLALTIISCVFVMLL